MNRNEFDATLQLLGSQAAIISELPIADCINSLNRAETVGPILDPTLMQRYLRSTNSRDIPELLHAALEFQKAIIKIKARHIAKEPA